MRYSVREANQQDHKALNELFAEGDRFHREALPYLFQAPDGPARSEEFLSGVGTFTTLIELGPQLSAYSDPYACYRVMPNGDIYVLEPSKDQVKVVKWEYRLASPTPVASQLAPWKGTAEAQGIIAGVFMNGYSVVLPNVGLAIQDDTVIHRLDGSNGKMADLVTGMIVRAKGITGRGIPGSMVAREVWIPSPLATPTPPATTFDQASSQVPGLFHRRGSPYGDAR